MNNCELDLPNQGQILRHSRVQGTTGRKIAKGTQKTPICHLFLFQQTVVLCREIDGDKLSYMEHINVNKMRVRDTVAEHDNVFEIHNLEEETRGPIDDAHQDEEGHECDKVVIMRIECKSEKEKDEWVKALNKEVKQIRLMAKNLSSQCLVG